MRSRVGIDLGAELEHEAPLTRTRRSRIIRSDGAARGQPGVGQAPCGGAPSRRVDVVEVLEAEEVAVGFGDDGDHVDPPGHLEEVAVQRVGRQA